MKLSEAQMAMLKRTADGRGFQDNALVDTRFCRPCCPHCYDRRTTAELAWKKLVEPIDGGMFRTAFRITPAGRQALESGE